jgi:4-amino-4-deoxy-L-arabinose transferase-like glycosyltransferase
LRALSRNLAPAAQSDQRNGIVSRYNCMRQFFTRGAMSNTPTNSAHLARQSMAGGRAWRRVVLFALAPLWFLGIFDRALWTPDEPREADIAWHMTLQSAWAIPELAGTPFLEKPPLTYWLSAAATSAFGDSAAIARLPNLLYAAIVALAIGALAFAMAGSGAAVVAALVAGSAIIAYRVAIWLAPDAALLAGTAIALLGAYLGYTCPTGVRKLAGYTLMHAGAAFGFMAKSAPGWIVPALALITLIIWERRWSELRRWELYAGALLQLLLIGPWIMAVAGSPGGGASLHVLLWDNIVGRFTAVAASPGHDYAQGHLNWWGKYLIELPIYLLPWTVLAAAGLKRAWSTTHATAGDSASERASTAWRFAVAASLPFLALLSLAATARDVYAAPAMLGFALLVGLWAQALPQQCSRFDAVAFAATRALVALLASLFVAALVILSMVAQQPARVAIDLGAAVAVAALVFALIRYAARLQHAGRYVASIGATYAAYSLALTLSGLLVLPEVDRWQDLGALAQRIERDAAGGELAVLNPDETTVAMLDYRSRTTFAALAARPAETQRVLSEWLQARGAHAHVLVLLPGHAPGAITELLGRRFTIAVPDDGLAGHLEAAGSAQISGRYELPQGRRYALLGLSSR